MKSLCELCGYVVRGDHYSLEDCNETGRGVVLHKRCCERLEGARQSLHVPRVLMSLSGVIS